MRHLPETTVSRNGIGHVQFGCVWNQQIQGPKVELQVEVVVSHVHPLVRVLRLQPRGPLDGTRERGIGGRERRLPHLGKFVHKPWSLGLVGLIVHEDDSSLAGEDHARQGRPIIPGHGDLGRRVDQIPQSRALDGFDEIIRRNVVCIADEDGDHVIRMRSDPLRDRGQICLKSAHVEQVTVTMAEVDGAVDHMGLELHLKLVSFLPDTLGVFAVTYASEHHHSAAWSRPGPGLQRHSPV